MRKYGKIIKNCEICDAEFKTKQSIINIGSGRFCSKKCFYIWKSTVMKEHGIVPVKTIGHHRIKVRCKECGNDMMVMPCSLKKGRGKFCSNKCYHSWKSANARGEKSNRWKGGITTAISGTRTLKAYSEWRISVFKRDMWTCVKCGEKQKIQAHHIKKFSTIIDDTIQKYPLFRVSEIAPLINELWDVNNGVTLCVGCHKKEHARKK